VGERSYLAIGDVLALLREEFPDVTISKIRFLESRGLLVPERTPSGYRKFYEPDVDRLRWILRQQREHFLPLKVIKGRLDNGMSDPCSKWVTRHLRPRRCPSRCSSVPREPPTQPRRLLTPSRP
jgi:DNA-binding transcriptional MerR regulator